MLIIDKIKEELKKENKEINEENIGKKLNNLSNEEMCQYITEMMIIEEENEEKYEEDQEIVLAEDGYTTIILRVKKGDAVLSPEELVCILDENEMILMEENRKNKRKQTIYIR